MWLLSGVCFDYPCAGFGCVDTRIVVVFDCIFGRWHSFLLIVSFQVISNCLTYVCDFLRYLRCLRCLGRF